MSFKAVKIVEALYQEYQDNLTKINEYSQIVESHGTSTMGAAALQAQGVYINANHTINRILMAGVINPLMPLDGQMLTVERTMALCSRRGWPADWASRMAILTEELAEYFAAVRGKGSQDVVGEGGDMLNAMYAALAISGRQPIHFEEAMIRKVNQLWDSPRRPGEHYVVSEDNPVQGDR